MADRQNGHTIHMVKGAAKTAAPAASSSVQAQRLPQMGTGLNVAGNPVDSIENIQHVRVVLVCVKVVLMLRASPASTRSPECKAWTT